MSRVMTTCAETGRIVATQLDLSVKALSRVRGARAFYCPVCRVGHIVEPAALWLEDDVSSEQARGGQGDRDPGTAAEAQRQQATPVQAQAPSAEGVRVSDVESSHTQLPSRLGSSGFDR